MNVPIISLRLMKTVFESEHPPTLIGAQHTHDAAVRFVAQLVKERAGENQIIAIVAAALPADYAGDTLKELPEMIAGACRKGFADDSAAPQPGYQMTPEGLFLNTEKQGAII
jgi:hypothetical protein